MNFDLALSGQRSILLIGKNGSGKTTVCLALEVLQKIARGTNRIGHVVTPDDFLNGRTDGPMRFEIQVQLDGEVYEYVIALALPSGSRELQVLEEKLTIGGKPLFTRESANVHLLRPGQGGDASFSIDWHLAALPIIQEQSSTDPLFIFRRWLGRTLILRPIPGLIKGDSDQESLQPTAWVTDFGAWFSGLLAYAPSAYSRIEKYLKEVMPDLSDIKNPVLGRNYRSLKIQFSGDQRDLSFPFGDLSDGEKCFMICALVLAANKALGPLLCFWDEPDNYLALSEVGHFVLALRREFESGGQFIATSHNPEAIRRFSDENTFVLLRRNHLEPTIIRPLNELQVDGDLVDALITGDLEP